MGNNRIGMEYSISWQEVETACDLLVQNLQGKEFSSIIPVLRGGMIPGTILSHRLNIPIAFAVNPKCGVFSSKASDLLIVDEICDTGTTFQSLRERFPNATYAATFVKPAGKPFCDTYGPLFHQAVWCKMPWEVD